MRKWFFTDARVCALYDAVNAAIFFTSGGSGRLRQAFVDALDVHNGQRLIEFGCGTGQVTKPLCDAGADVTAVDQLPAMLVGRPKTRAARDVRRV